jgi:proprotein convertase subtilisin/kexin type 5
LNITLPSSYQIINSVGLSNCILKSIDPLNNVIVYTLNSYQNIGIQLVLINPLSIYNSIIINTYLSPGVNVDSGLFTPINPCSNNCRSCLTDNITCLTCYITSSNYLFSNGNCLKNCSYNQFINTTNNSCSQCQNICLSCSSNDICISCNSSSLYPIFFNNTCLSNCPLGYFNNTATSCLSCPSSCLACSLYTFCSICNINYGLYNNTCLGNCPNGTYLLNQICNNCTNGCLICTTQGCTQCNSTTLLYQLNCVTTCPENLYSDTIGNCKLCLSPCSSCNNTIYSCTSCINLYFLFNNICNTTCPSGYFADSIKLNCIICASPCLTCINSNTTCLTC